MVAPSTALSLLAKSKHVSHGPEIDQHVMALLASHGPDAVERAVQAVADQLAGRSMAWPSDVRKALEAELGPVPAEAKPSPLDDTGRAAAEMRVDIGEYVERIGAGVEPDPEERKAILERQRANRGAA